jgi:hypothetical protein
MKWVHTGEHVDGAWHKVFATEAKALASVAKYLGRDTDYGEPLVAGRQYVDDNGGTHRVSQTSATSAHTADALRKAYDARECETATKRQLALLERHGL